MLPFLEILGILLRIIQLFFSGKKYYLGLYSCFSSTHKSLYIIYMIYKLIQLVAACSSVTVVKSLICLLCFCREQLDFGRASLTDTLQESLQ